MTKDPKYVTDNFTEEELGVHEFPAELAGIDRERIRSCARILCMELLEPARAWLGEPLIVTSGYRPPEHNRAIGGKDKSFHLYRFGQAAADALPKTKPVIDLFDWLRLESGLPFDKVILEVSPGSWVNALLDSVRLRLTEGEELKVILQSLPGLKPLVVHFQTDVNNAPRRLAFIGCTGDGQKYVPVEVEGGIDAA